MLPSTAVDLVNNIIYEPGWTFTATDFTDRFESAIVVRIEYEARNWNREHAPEYKATVHAGASFPLQIADLDAEGLYRKVFDVGIMGIVQHEAREAFRIAPTCWAPFHPHKVDGMKRWGTPQADLMFGVV